MDTWLNYPGFPVISVQQEKTQLTLKQNHFSENAEKADPNRIWPVPLFGGRGDVPEMLSTTEETVMLDNDEFVRIDQEARGHYIVHYKTPAQHEALVQLVKSNSVSVVDRLMALTGSDLLARAGYDSFGQTLHLLEAYKDESHEPVWDAISIAIGDARRFIDYDDTLEPKIKAFVRPLIKQQYDRLGWETIEGESASDQKLRATIIGLGSYAEEPAIVERAKELFNEFVRTGDGLSPELRHIVFSVAVKNDLPGAVDELLELHDTTTNSEVKTDVALSLTATRSVEVAQRLLGRLQDPELVKPQDADRWMVYIMRNRYTRELGWQWMVDNWGWIEKTYGNDKSYDYMPRYAASCCNTNKWRERFIDFFEPKQDQLLLRRNILMGIEEITNRVAWLERDLKAVQEFFK
jgi:aminopeptidase N